MKRILPLFAAGFAIALAMPAAAQTLYAVSVRTYSDPGYHGVEGNLYTVDPETASTNLVTSLNVSGKTPVGLDGLAIHPRTGVFYGITAPTSAVIPRIPRDPRSRHGQRDARGRAEPDRLRHRLRSRRHALHVAARDAPARDREPRQRAGDDARRTHRARRRQGRIRADRRRQGLRRGHRWRGNARHHRHEHRARSRSAPPSPARPSPISSTASRTPKGLLYGINTSFGRSTQANLITIDPVTGKVANIGALPNDTDALTFGPSTEPKDMAASLMEWRIPVLVALFVFAMIVIIVALRLTGKR